MVTSWQYRVISSPFEHVCVYCCWCDEDVFSAATFFSGKTQSLWHPSSKHELSINFIAAFAKLFLFVKLWWPIHDDLIWHWWWRSVEEAYKDRVRQQEWNMLVYLVQACWSVYENAVKEHASLFSAMCDLCMRLENLPYCCKYVMYFFFCYRRIGMCECVCVWYTFDMRGTSVCQKKKRCLNFFPNKN